MKRVFSTICSCLVGLVCFTVSAAAVEAAGYLKFDQSSITATGNNTFQVQVIVDPGTDEIAGTDAHVTYDATLLEAVSVSAGSYFPSVSNNISTGKVSIWGVTVPASPKTGVGTIATVTFKSLKNGTATLQYYCDATASNSSKIVKADINATNIISCSQNQTATVTVSGASSSTPAPTATSSNSKPAPTAVKQLPQSGSFDSIAPVTAVGAFLLIMGAVVRYIVL